LIAFGARIENAHSGNSTDTLLGNDLANNLNAKAVTIFCLVLNDSLLGGSVRHLSGGSGTDSLMVVMVAIRSLAIAVAIHSRRHQCRYLPP
jgi:cation transporter-like permease